MLIRLALFGAIALTLMSGLFKVFIEPTPENAEAMLKPSAAEIQENTERTKTVLSWIFSQTPESIAGLIKDAKEDVADKLDVQEADLKAFTSSGERRKSSGASAGGAPQLSKGPENGPPGLDWYKNE